MSFLKKHHINLLALFALLAIVVSVSVAVAAPPASLYNPGETLEPNCAPGDLNCSVKAPAISGNNSDITSLSSLTTALSVAQGGTGLDSISANKLLYSSALNTLSELSLDSTFSIIAGVMGITDSSITESMLDILDSPADGEILSWNNANNKFEWIVDAVGGGGSGNSIWDTDSDTGIQAEETADEDIIRFDTAGVERARIEADGKMYWPAGDGGNLVWDPTGTGGLSKIGGDGFLSILGALLVGGDGHENATFSVKGLTGIIIANFRDADGENIFKSEGSISGDDLSVKFGDMDFVGNGTSLEIDYSNQQFLFHEGRVGIGTNSPQYDLDINTANDDGTIAADRGKFGQRNNNSVSIGFDMLGDEVGMSWNGNDELIAGINSTQTAYKYGGWSDNTGFAVNLLTGNVGVRTTSPNSRFQVVNDDGNSLLEAGYSDSRIVKLGDISEGSWGTMLTVDGEAGVSYFEKGNLGIGTTNPGEKLEVDGGIKYNTTNAKPVCDATNRGTTWFTQGAPGVKDDFEVCAKDAGDLYAWRTIY
ncbi:MAG: hypothetical protein RBS56_00635 [Candidatus Gracilibacteria bacterium]|jgi:hypothetical protein|nr:hypothetical protein [Candidatus Gracilibacteria bacterium]